MGTKAGFTEEERGQIMAFRKANYSIRKIAKELNRSKTLINVFLDDPEEWEEVFWRKTEKTLEI